MPTAEQPLKMLGDTSNEQLNDYARNSVLCGSFVVMVAFVLGNVVHLKKINWLPEPLIAVGCGALLGYTLWATAFGGQEFELDGNVVTVVFRLFLQLVALPIIIFEAGWSLRIRDFVCQLGYILLFAVLGTLIAVMVITVLFYLTHGSWTQRFNIIDLRTAIAFASLLSSVDPVATLATFGHLNVDPLLFIMVFGESQINDAVALTLFNGFNHHHVTEVPELCWQMFSQLFGSIGIGAILGILYILVLRYGRMAQSPAQELLFLFVSPFFTYQFAEFVTMSGIIAVLFCAIFMSAYAGPHLTIEGTMLASFLFKQMASLAEMLIFLLVGVAVVYVGHDDLVFGLYTMVYVLVARAFTVSIIGVLTNCIKRCVSWHLPAEKRHMLTWKHMFMMWHGGVCRGGLSLVLAMDLGPWVDEQNGPGTKSRLQNATFIMICAFLLLFGGTTSVCMRWLGLPMGDAVCKERSLYQPTDKHGWAWKSMQWVQKKIMIPLLVGNVIPASHCKGTMNAVLENAGASEQQVANASQLSSPRKLSSERLRSSMDDLFDLFGTDDPAHVEQIEDVQNALCRVTSTCTV